MSGPADIMARFRRGVDEEMERRWLSSPLAEWMATHHDRAAELLAHQHMNWAKAAEAFAGAGLTDQLGEQPTAETARETWQLVEARRRARMQLR